MINAIEAGMDMAAEVVRSLTSDERFLNMLSEYILCGWPSGRAEEQKNLQPYCFFQR